MKTICTKCKAKPDNQWATNQTEATLEVTVTYVPSGDTTTEALCEWCAQNALGLALDGRAILSIEQL